MSNELETETKYSANRTSVPLTVRREGDSVTVSSTRTVYQVVVGQVYYPLGKIKDSAPKRLIALAPVGDEWQVQIGPVDNGRGRARGMLLASFLTRYIQGAPIERPKKKMGARKAQLDRIEAKLDTILAQLGVEYSVCR